MSIIETAFRTITCNAEGCPNTATFDVQYANTPAGNKELLEANLWIKTTRVVSLIADGRNFCYCSDVCEVKGIESGTHNPVEKKVIEMPSGPALEAVKRAALAAKATEEGTKALKDGRPVNIQPGR